MRNEIKSNINEFVSRQDDPEWREETKKSFFRNSGRSVDDFVYNHGPLDSDLALVPSEVQLRVSQPGSENEWSEYFLFTRDVIIEAVFDTPEQARTFYDQMKEDLIAGLVTGRKFKVRYPGRENYHGKLGTSLEYVLDDAQGAGGYFRLDYNSSGTGAQLSHRSGDPISGPLMKNQLEEVGFPNGDPGKSHVRAWNLEPINGEKWQVEKAVIEYMKAKNVSFIVDDTASNSLLAYHIVKK